MAKQVKKQTKKTSKKSTVNSKKKGVTKKVSRVKAKGKVTKKKAAPKASSTKRQKVEKKVSKKAKPAKKKPLKKVKKSKANNPLLKPVTLSPEIAAVVGGHSELPRTEVVKKVWQYIKKNNLQDSKDRKLIHADEKLKVIFKGRASVNMFELTKFVSKHLNV